MKSMSVLTISLIISCIATISLAIGFFVWLHYPRRRLHQTFLFIMTGIAIWSGGFVLMLVTGFPSFFDETTLFGGLIIAYGFFLLSYFFPQERTQGIYFWVGFSVFCVNTILVFLGLFISDVVIDGLQVEPINTEWFPFYAGSLVLFVLSALIRLGIRYKQSLYQDKQKIGYFFFGTLSFLCTALLFDGILPALGIYDFNVIGFISPLIFVGFLAYAIIRHRLMDIRIVIQRGLMYATLLFFILAGYTLFLFALRHLTDFQSDKAVFASGALTAFFGAVSFSGLQKFFRRITDPVFFKDVYRYEDAMEQLVGILYRFHSLYDMEKQTSLLLQKIFRAQSVDFKNILDEHLDEDQQKQKIMIAPIIFDAKISKYLVVGYKMSGDFYNERDEQLLDTFSYQAALAFEKARLYDQVQHHAEHFEKTVADRTRTIKDMHESQTQMMVDISHSVQTPLTILQGQLDNMAIDKSLPAEVTEPLRSTLENLSNFIYRLLYFARLGSGGSADTFQEFSLDRLLTETSEFFETVAMYEDVKFQASIQEEVDVYGSREDIRECIMNLISNAVKYRRANVESLVELSMTADESRIQIIVRDNGQGIAEKDQGKIFDQYYRSPHSQQKGTGLGLAICKRIVEQHQGKISVISSVGKGSSFLITLPRIKEKISQ